MVFGDTVTRTGERHTPERVRSAEDRCMDLRHRYAYQVARDHAVPNSRVLEVGFGEGYGAAMIADVIANYEGVEVSKDLIRSAQERYPFPNLNFRLYDGPTLPFADNSFDLVISFQVIEHVHDVGRYVRELHRVSKPRSTILVTTPNRLLRLREGERPWNRYHLVEFSPSQLAGALHVAFPQVEIHGIHAAPEVIEVELHRLKRLRRLARLDRIGLRYLLPERVTSIVSRGLARVLGARAPSDAPEFSMSQFWHSTESVEAALDLLAVIRR